MASAVGTQWTDLISALKSIVGDKGLITDPQETVSYCEDYRHLFRGRTPAVVRPANTEEVSRVVRLCNERGVAIVPQGGNTGMMGGAVPSDDNTQIVLSLTRMNRIRHLDPIDMTMTVDGGVTLQQAKDAAGAQDCTVPLTMGSDGSAQLGGVFATNAGGNNTVRFGNARDFVLGLEVVLPDGQIWNGLRRLRKDNTGYCLRQLFVGSEGTLGIITGAVLKLVPQLHDIALAFVAVTSAQAALDLFVLCRRRYHEAILSFEYMHHGIVDVVLKNVPECRSPLEKRYDHYAIVELAGPEANSGMREALESVLEQGMDAGLVLDGAIAGTAAERAAVWQMREGVVEGQAREGASIKNDITVPVSRVPEFVARANEELPKRFPGIRFMTYGHMGDGNLHFNFSPPIGTDNETFKAQSHDIMVAVMELVRDFDGSFSAEHGIGQIKPYMMAMFRKGPELETMQRIKAALDPKGIMNPGKVLP